MKIYIDFEGTIFEPDYHGKIGRCNFGCFEVIKKLQDAGHEIILNTSLVEDNDGFLEKVLEYINENNWMFVSSEEERNDFTLKEIKANPIKLYPNKFDLDEIKKTGIMFIDDNAFKIPLRPAVTIDNFDIVDWYALDEIFESNGFYYDKI